MTGLNEVDPVLSIECLDPVPPKQRLTAEEIYRRIRGDGADAGAQDQALFTGCRTG